MDLIKQDRFKLALVVTEDLAVYKYTSKNKGELSHPGSFGFSYDPESGNVLYWVKDGDNSYRFKEVSNEELFAPYPHHELLGRKVNENLKEVIKKWL